MPFDWTPAVVADGALAFARLRPNRILYELDGEPLLFVSSTRRDLSVLCYKTDDDDTFSQYIVSPTNEAIIDNLINGNISLRSAVVQPWLWVADLANSDYGVRATWTLNPNTIPDALLPKLGRSLYNSKSVIIERTTKAANQGSLQCIDPFHPDRGP